MEEAGEGVDIKVLGQGCPQCDRLEQELMAIIAETGIPAMIEDDQSLLVIPGLAESEKNAIRQLSRWTVLVGPVSGFLIPLFLWENELWN